MKLERSLEFREQSGVSTGFVCKAECRQIYRVTMAQCAEAGVDHVRLSPQSLFIFFVKQGQAQRACD